MDYLLAMRVILGDVPIMVSCPLKVFESRLDAGTLPGNVWYCVRGDRIPVEQANRLMAKVWRFSALGNSM